MFGRLDEITEGRRELDAADAAWLQTVAAYDRSGEWPVDLDAASWDLQIVAFELATLELCVDRVVLHASGSPPKLGMRHPSSDIWLESAFAFTSRAGTRHQLHARNEWETLTPLFELRRAAIQAAFARRDGTLTIASAAGSTVEVPTYHAGSWHARRPDGLMMSGTTVGDGFGVAFDATQVHTEPPFGSSAT